MDAHYKTVSAESRSFSKIHQAKRYSPFKGLAGVGLYKDFSPPRHGQLDWVFKFNPVNSIPGNYTSYESTHFNYI